METLKTLEKDPNQTSRVEIYNEMKTILDQINIRLDIIEDKD